MIDFARTEIKEMSDKAISEGNEFPGYLGHSPKEFTGDELGMLLNVVYSELKKAQAEKYAKDVL